MPSIADIELLKDLIRIHPVTASVDAVNRAVDRMAGYLSEAGIRCVVEQFGDRKILYASSVESKEPDLLLNVHLDVVPATENSQTEPEIRNDRLYGRGANDCLGNAVCASRFLIDNCRRYSIGIVFSTDEETGGSTTRWMAERGYTGKRFVVVIDGSGGCIGIAQKGILVVKLRAVGKGGHSALPFDIDNPIDRLIEGYQKLRKAWRNPSSYEEWINSMVPCIISSGEACNQVGDYAEMVINCRYVTENGAAGLVDYIRRETGLEVEILQECEPMLPPEDLSDLEFLRGIMATTLGREVKFERFCGATDARYFRRPGLPVAIIGLEGGGIHSAGEYLQLDSIDAVCRVLAALAERLS